MYVRINSGEMDECHMHTYVILPFINVSMYIYREAYIHISNTFLYTYAYSLHVLPGFSPPGHETNLPLQRGAPLLPGAGKIHTYVYVYIDKELRFILMCMCILTHTYIYVYIRPPRS